MIERHAQYLTELRARHAEDVDILKRVLVGRRPGLLRTLKKYHAGIESETARILALIDRRETGRVS